MINYSMSYRSAQPGTIKSQITDRKVYAVAQLSGSVATRELAKHIAVHGGWGIGTVIGVIESLPECIKEFNLQGMKVDLGTIGSFYPSLTSKGEHNVDEFSAADITGVNINFAPGEMFKNLRSEAQFQLVASREDQAAALKAEKEAMPHSEKTDDGKTNVD